jgi:hypothetical protein
MPVTSVMDLPPSRGEERYEVYLLLTAYPTPPPLPAVQSVPIYFLQLPAPLQLATSKKNSREKLPLLFVGIMKITEENSRIRIRACYSGIDPRIRIHIKGNGSETLV